MAMWIPAIAIPLPDALGSAPPTRVHRPGEILVERAAVVQAREAVDPGLVFGLSLPGGHRETLLQEAAMRDKQVSVLMLDIDHFKVVNDTHGHDVGDAVLREFAERVQRNIRGIDLACRLGGEEFVVVMPDTDLAKAYLIGERLRQCIAATPFYVGDRASALKLTASVGVAAMEQPSDTPSRILKRADQALYCAKRDGRNCVVADAA